MGTAFFAGSGGEYIFSCVVHGSKMISGEVMFLAAVAWMEGRGEKKLLRSTNSFLIIL